MPNEHPTILEVKHLTKNFRGQPALSDVSFDVKEGDVVCLLGPSGAGKTTLLRCLAGLESIDGGSMTYLGKHTIDPNDVAALTDIRKSISFVFQDFQLWSNKTVLENICLAPTLVQGWSKQEARLSAETLLKKFGLLDKKDVYPDFLSGGQKQRVAIVRALAMKPAIIFFDEITSALDPELIRSVLESIKLLAKEGQTMVIATHDLRFATEVADRIVFLDHGSIVQQETSSRFIYAQNNERIRSFLKSLASHEQEINVYEGYDEFQSYHLGLMRRLKEGTTIHVAGAVGDRWYECMGEYYKEYEALRIKKNIKWEMLHYQESPIDARVRAEHPGLTEYRLFSKDIKNPANYNVMEDLVIIQTFGPRPSVIEIRNPDVAHAYLQYFHLLWETGERV